MFKGVLRDIKNEVFPEIMFKNKNVLKKYNLLFKIGLYKYSEKTGLFEYIILLRAI
jgi:hypothetical protein